MDTFSITSTVRSYPKRLPFREIKDMILGKKYELSLVFVGATRAKQLNESYRSKTYVPNVLSFPLSESAGEVYICPKVAAKEAKEFDLSVNGYMAFLFIHGCLHLKGYDHGDTMEKLERKYCKAFDIS
ncbi:MAG: rRNA maturation RNase YbeY, partial [Candidatus Kaiserbacteria bacterium]|nr:rRNA maturation RNase YbeY [Candidatus Kaiserbacteria bacterium]MCB9816730.1 rRNA maturation RNase YbeY [Candidatus Nomurabacteria bacterium]